VGYKLRAHTAVALQELLMERARALRRGQTDAEKKLWSRLRASQLGAKFRRQHPIGGYIADFCCIEQRLIVELDGGQHFEQRGYDLRRSQALEALGFRVLRFWNDDVLLRTDDGANAFLLALKQPPPPHPNPLPRYGRGRGGKGCSARITAAVGLETPSSPTGSSLGERVGVRGRGLKEEPSQEKPGGSFLRREALHFRARLNALIRDFFAQRGVLEVETPVLSAAGNTDVHIEGFATQFSGHAGAGARERFLRTSPEYPLKRLLANGVGDCYELGRVFRNGEAGRSHNPEFTLLEWYRVGWDHHRLMDECAGLVGAAMALAGHKVGVRKTSYVKWFQDELDLDPSTATEAELRSTLAE
jgi:lysyl-tRNA synthetase class 2